MEPPVGFELTGSCLGGQVLRESYMPFRDGDKPTQLRHVAWFEFVERGDTEQAHRAFYLTAKNLDHAVHTVSPTSHEAVEVGSPDERELRPERTKSSDPLPSSAGHPWYLRSRTARQIPAWESLGNSSTTMGGVWRS